MFEDLSQGPGTNADDVGSIIARGIDRGKLGQVIENRWGQRGHDAFIVDHVVQESIADGSPESGLLAKNIGQRPKPTIRHQRCNGNGGKMRSMRILILDRILLCAKENLSVYGSFSSDPLPHPTWPR